VLPQMSYEPLPNGKFRATFLNRSTGTYDSNFVEPELSEEGVKRRISNAIKTWGDKNGE
jgi:hypothetical protein